MIESIKKIVTFSFLGLIGASYLALGYDLPIQMVFRLPWLFLTAGIFIFIAFRDQWSTIKTLPFSFWCFFLFFLFEIFRAGYALFFLKDEQSLILAKKFIVSPMWWGAHLGVFMLASALFKQRKTAVFYLLTVMGVCVFIALNAIPGLLENGSLGYRGADGKSGFFLPFFYAVNGLSQLIFSRFAHPNNVSTIIGAGFMPVLGYALYLFLAWIDTLKPREKHRQASPNPMLLNSAVLFFVFAGVIGSVVLLIQSRAGVAVFAGAIFLFLTAIFLKYPSLLTGVILAGVLAAGGAFFLWTGNLDKLQKEMQTLQIEQEAAEINPEEAYHKGASIYSNIAGKQNALKLYEKNPVWGVGYAGYMEGVKSLEHEKGYERYQFAKAFALSHYFQILAEEGKGAVLYFIFLAVYFVEVIWRLLKTNSRFQFFAAVSLVCSVVMMLGHGAVNELLQRFTTSFILYAFMGASLAFSSKEFKHT